MGQSSPEILVYITDNKERIISGDPLTLYIPDSVEQLKNGDHVLISR